jgi:hypothetical protein
MLKNVDGHVVAMSFTDCIHDYLSGYRRLIADYEHFKNYYFRIRSEYTDKH